MRITIVKTQALFGAFVIFCFLAISGLAAYTLSELRIGSEAYDRIISGKDLVADVLPPPEYIIEAYLETNLAERFGASTARQERLRQLHKDFDERREVWQKSSLPQSLKLSITEGAAQPANAFWKELETVYLPALGKGDKAAGAQSFVKLTDLYQLHRTAIDKVVEQSNTFLADAEADARRRVDIMQTIALVVIACVLLMIGLATWLVQHHVAKPIGRIVAQMSSLARDEVVVPLDLTKRQDEIGEMARAVGVFTEAAAEKKSLEAREVETRLAREAERAHRQADAEAAAKQAEFVLVTLADGLGKLSDGDLVQQIGAKFSDQSDALRRDFNASVSKLREVVLAVVRNADSIRTGSQEISVAADDLSRRTDNQAASLEQTAASLSQLTTTVKRTAESAVHARDVVSQAMKDAEHGGTVAHQAVDAMKGIENASQQISQIIGVIDEIAFQTNLLALNAGVEAARAGESGRGFAVVASEVRALAQRSAEAAKEIKQLITSSQMQVETGVKLVSETGGALARIVTEVKELTGIVNVMSASANEQSTGLQEISAAVNDMDQVTQQNAAMVQESTAASHALARQAEDLTKLVGRFQVNSGGASVAPPRRTEVPVAKRPVAVAAPQSHAPDRRKKVANGGDWDEF